MNLILVGLLIALIAFAWLQNRRAVRTRSTLEKELREAPAKIVSALRMLTRASKDRSPIDFAAGGESIPIINLIDVNGDGHEELLLQRPTGAHGSELKVFAWQSGEFKEIAHLGVGTPAGFDFGDFDGDGRIEIKAEETDWSTGEPYVSAPRLTILFRWNGTGFAEIARQRSSTEFS